jgi:hypothetical protein
VLAEVELFGRVVFEVPAQSQWQRDAADAVMGRVHDVCSQAHALRLSSADGGGGCKDRAAAAGIKRLVAGQGLSAADVAYKLHRHDNHLLGLSVLMNARFQLGEMGAAHDGFWGFSYW